MAFRTVARSSKAVSSALNLGLWLSKRVRLVRQAEVAECGLASLTMIANYHGFDTDLGTLRRRFQPSMRGAPLRSLITTADQLGFTTRAVRIPLERLQDLHLPAVLHWNMSHYVVVERVGHGKGLIHNPEGFSRWMCLEEISNHFTGVALELWPAENFEPLEQRERLRLSQLWRRISGLKRAVIQTIVL